MDSFSPSQNTSSNTLPESRYSIWFCISSRFFFLFLHLSSLYKNGKYYDFEACANIFLAVWRHWWIFLWTSYWVVKYIYFCSESLICTITFTQNSRQELCKALACRTQKAGGETIRPPRATLSLDVSRLLYILLCVVKAHFYKPECTAGKKKSNRERQTHVWAWLSSCTACHVLPDSMSVMRLDLTLFCFLEKESNPVESKFVVWQVGHCFNSLKWWWGGQLMFSNLSYKDTEEQCHFNIWFSGQGPVTLLLHRWWS